MDDVILSHLCVSKMDKFTQSIKVLNEGSSLDWWLARESSIGGDVPYAIFLARMTWLATEMQIARGEVVVPKIIVSSLVNLKKLLLWYLVIVCNSLESQGKWYILLT